MPAQAKPFITPEQYLEIERDAEIKSALSVLDGPLPMAEIYRNVEFPETPPPLPR